MCTCVSVRRFVLTCDACDLSIYLFSLHLSLYLSIYISPPIVWMPKKWRKKHIINRPMYLFNRSDSLLCSRAEHIKHSPCQNADAFISVNYYQSTKYIQWNYLFCAIHLCMMFAQQMKSSECSHDPIISFSLIDCNRLLNFKLFENDYCRCESIDFTYTSIISTLCKSFTICTLHTEQNCIEVISVEREKDEGGTWWCSQTDLIAMKNP